MNASARAELSAIKRELDAIIAELTDVSNGVRKGSAGIGSELCANSIDKAISQYRYVRRTLENMDTTTVTDSFAAAHGLN